MALASAADYYQRQRRLNALAVRAGRRARGRGDAAVAAAVVGYQAASVALAETAATAILAEQDIDPAMVGALAPPAFITEPRALAEMVGSAASNQAMDRLVSTLVNDAGRSGMGVTTIARPAVTGHVRYLSPPSCSRCAILAGRFYRWSSGFDRHPECDCQMVPSNEAAAEGLIGNPMEAFEKGQIRNSRIDKETGERVYSPGLTKADAQAIRDGADISQVVNIRRKEAGLIEGSSVLARGGRLTPAGINRLASNRDEALDLLRRNGYLNGQPVHAVKRAGKTTLDPQLVKDMAGGSAEKFLIRNADGTASFVASREKLHDTIIDKLLRGGKPQKSPTYNVFGGGPASGKSGMEKAAGLSEVARGVKLDPDAVKAMLPEWSDAKTAAAFTHEESSYIIKRAQAKAFERRFNVTLDGTGNGSLSSLHGKIERARANGYEVNGYYVSIPTDEAVRRSMLRASKPPFRMVPEKTIRDTHRNVSKALGQSLDKFDRLELYDNSGSGVVKVLDKQPGQKPKILRPDLWAKFLAKANG